MGKTNAVRLVEQAGVAYRCCAYKFDENDLSGTHAADAIGMPHDQVFKTLVARGAKKGIAVFCIPVCCSLNLKSAAKAFGASILIISITDNNIADNFFIISFPPFYRFCFYRIIMRSYNLKNVFTRNTHWSPSRISVANAFLILPVAES